jgi:6-pyruvoyl-tetrahydropterin synthase
MSNIIFKGNTKKTFGEYFPNIYIDRVVVRNDGTDAVFLDISYSLFFHITDEFNKEDILKILKNVNFYFAMSNVISNTDQRLSKSQLILDLRDKSPAFSEDSISSRTAFYSFSKEKILDNLNNDLFTSDVYDSQDRRVMVVNAEETISYSTIERRKKHIYLYAFTSLYDLPAFEILIDDKLNSNKIYDLSISDISYEKIFSTNLNILDQAEIIFVDANDSKYQEVPILGLDGSFYKTETITRESIITQVNTLTNRFTSRISGTPLKQSIDSIKYVIQQFGGSEKLLVELDRVRKSFPNKTNNNRLGNLYAAFSKLLITINSGFLSTEFLAKQKMLTGKVIDRREELRYDRVFIPMAEHDQFIPSDSFLMDRTRLSFDETNDLSKNSGTFLIRFEAILRQKSKLSRLLNIERLLEFTIPSLQVDFKRLLLGHLRSTDVFIQKYETSSGDFMTSNRRNYNSLSSDRKFQDSFAYNPSSVGTLRDADLDAKASISEEYHEMGGTTPEIVSSYLFEDLDRYISFYELEQNENGGMVFDYTVTAKYLDLTLRVADYIEAMLNYHMALFYQYSLTANEICSYNNIQNRFNDFFVEEITKRYDDVYKFYPWETSVFAYSLAQYVLTDRFENLEDVARYSRNLIKTVSPSQGTLESISNLFDEMKYFYSLYYGSDSDYNVTKQSLQSEPIILEIQKSFNVELLTNNPGRLQLDALEDYRAYIINLFRRADPVNIVNVDSADGRYIETVTESADGSGVSVSVSTGYSNSEFHSRIKEFIGEFLRLQVVQIVIVVESRTSENSDYRHHYDPNYLATFPLDQLRYMDSLYSDMDSSSTGTAWARATNMWVQSLTAGGASTIEAVVAGSVSNVIGTIFTDALFERNSALAQDGGMTEPFDFSDVQRKKYRDAMAAAIYSSLRFVLKAEYEAIARNHARLGSGDARLSEDEKNNLVAEVEITDYNGADQALNEIVNLVFKYYRDNNEQLLLSLNPSNIDSGARGDYSLMVDRVIQGIDRDYPPVPPLPLFVTQELGDSFGYNGVMLESIPDLDYDEELAQT